MSTVGRGKIFWRVGQVFYENGRNSEMKSKKIAPKVEMKYLSKAGMDPPPRGEGGVPRQAPHCGEGGVPCPAPPSKNDQNGREIAGQNKGPNLNFLQ